jgi:5,5'-dehydrodivanillate O-demethylase
VGQTEDSEAWKMGHPMLFPNILLSGNPYQNQMQFRVPMDDTHTRHFTVHTFQAAPGTAAPVQDVVPSRQFSAQDQQGRFLDLDVFFSQDYLVWVGQGPIARREMEKLGESDTGVIMFRRMLLQQVERMQRGEEPTLNVFRDSAANDAIDLPIEHVKPRSTRYVPTEPGYSRDRDKIEAVMETWASMHEAGAERLPPLVGVSPPPA